MINYLMYRIGQWIALRLPLTVSYAIAILISDFRYLYAAKDKKAVFENLRVIFPNKSAKEIKKIRFLMFRNFAKYLVDFFRFSILDKRYISKYINVKNAHYIDEALEIGKGVVL